MAADHKSPILPPSPGSRRCHIRWPARSPSTWWRARNEIAMSSLLLPGFPNPGQKKSPRDGCGGLDLVAQLMSQVKVPGGCGPLPPRRTGGAGQRECLPQSVRPAVRVSLHGLLAQIPRQSMDCLLMDSIRQWGPSSVWGRSHQATSKLARSRRYSRQDVAVDRTRGLSDFLGRKHVSIRHVSDRCDVSNGHVLARPRQSRRLERLAIVVVDH
jgi:hypothetical protein